MYIFSTIVQLDIERSSFYLPNAVGVIRRRYS
jgi:hypothetical protein